MKRCKNKEESHSCTCTHQHLLLWLLHNLLWRRSVLRQHHERLRRRVLTDQHVLLPFGDHRTRGSAHSGEDSLVLRRCNHVNNPTAGSLGNPERALRSSVDPGKHVHLLNCISKKSQTGCHTGWVSLSEILNWSQHKLFPAGDCNEQDSKRFLSFLPSVMTYSANLSVSAAC